MPDCQHGLVDTFERASDAEGRSFVCVCTLCGSTVGAGDTRLRAYMQAQDAQRKAAAREGQ